MWKKPIVLVLICILSIGMSGCNEVQDLTEEETRLIAEYAATALLKYDLNYTDRINEGNNDLSKLEEESQESSDTTEAITTQTTTEEVTTQEQGKDVSGKIEDDNTIEEETSVGREGDIAKLAGISGVSITYKDYLITDQYPATDTDGKFIYLEASKGYQLLVIRFSVKNHSDDFANVSLMDKDIDYRVVCNGTKAANPMLTILMDDLGTLETSVPAGEEQDAVLVFQISDAMKEQLESIELYINYDNMDNVIDIL